MKRIFIFLLTAALLPVSVDAQQVTVAANELQKSRSKHVALAAGGSLFVSSGLYAAAGTGSSENTFAPIDADGVAHVMILAGDDLNAPGNKSDKVIFY